MRTATLLIILVGGGAAQTPRSETWSTPGLATLLADVRRAGLTTPDGKDLADLSHWEARREGALVWAHPRGIVTPRRWPSLVREVDRAWQGYGLGSALAGPQVATLVFLPDAPSYGRYLQAVAPGRPQPLPLGHTEPDHCRLVVAVTASDATFAHECSHLLLEALRVPGSAGARARWFEEGMAHWMAGIASHGVPGSWDDALRETFALATSMEGLTPLLDAACSDRTPTSDASSYALVHFLHFGSLDPWRDAPFDPRGVLSEGPLMPGFQRWIRLQTEGRAGQPWSGRGAFAHAFGIADEDGWRRWEQAFARWQAWLVRKCQAGAASEGRLVPWWAHPRGHPEEDRLLL